jgi:hypothetical protein
MIPVTPMTVLQFNYGFHQYDNQTTYPDIVGFTEQQTLKQTVSMNSYYDADKTGLKYITIPAGVYFIKICGKFSTASILSADDSIINQLQIPYLADNSQLLKVGYPTLTTTGTTSNSFGITGSGTGFLPVAIGDTIRYNGFSTGSIYAVALFDSNKVLIRNIQTYRTRDSFYEYTLNPIDDVGAAYVYASSYQPAPVDFFTIESKKNLISTANYAINTLKAGAMTGRGKLTFIPLNANSAYLTTGLKFPKLQFNVMPAYITPSVVLPKDEINNLTVKCQAIKLRCSSITGQSTTLVSWYGVTSSDAANSSITCAVGDIFYMWGRINTSIQSSVISEFEVLDSIGFYMNSNVSALYGKNTMSKMLSDPKLLMKEYQFSYFCDTAAAAIRLSTYMENNRLVTFGDSITASGFDTVRRVAEALNLSYTNLAVGGSTPTYNSNLSPANLALIPLDTKLIILTGGTNGLNGVTVSGNITTRDTTTAEGCINFALDTMYSMVPSCRILLATPPQRSGSATNVYSQIFRDIAVSRGIPLIDTERNAGINQDTVAVCLYDGTHPSEEGIKRITGLWVGALRSILY